MTTDVAFMLCETCRMKDGSPLLCEGCIHNREAIHKLTEASTLFKDRHNIFSFKAGDVVIMQAEQALSAQMVERLKETWDAIGTGAKLVVLDRGIQIAPNYDVMAIQDGIAAATAHRACCGTEHDPAQGKLHGCCVVCGVTWPCETAQHYLVQKE